MVEFALVLPLLVTLLLGTITAGLTYNRAISMNNAARESARFGAVYPIDGDLTAWLNTVADVARESATGDLDPTSSGQHICVAYVHPDGAEVNDRTTSLTEIAGVRTVTVGGTCTTDGRADNEPRVQVYVERTSRLETGLWSRNITIDAQSIAHFERAEG